MTRRRVFATLILLCLCHVSVARAQLVTHERTEAPPESRFEILQSVLAARWTFLVDKFTGDIWQLATSSAGDTLWQHVPAPGRATNIPNHVNYQFFISGLAAKFMFLVNVNDGSTWQLANDSKADKLAWDPVAIVP